MHALQLFKTDLNVLPGKSVISSFQIPTGFPPLNVQHHEPLQNTLHFLEFEFIVKNPLVSNLGILLFTQL